MALVSAAAAPSEHAQFGQGQETFPWDKPEEAERYIADPKKYLLERCEKFIKNVEIVHNNLILATYFLPPWHQFKSGAKLFRADISIVEDIYQGKVGLLIAKGPMAFVDDPGAGRAFFGQTIEIGDWIVFDRSSGSRQLQLNGVHCRRLKDVEVVGKTTDPSMVY